MKKEIAIAFVITGLVAGYLIGKYTGRTITVEKPYPVVEVQFKDTCLTQVQIADAVLPIKKGKPSTKKEVIPTPKDSSIQITTTGTDSTFTVATKLYNWTYNEGLVKIEEYAIVKGEVLAFERTVTLDTPLIAASPIKPVVKEVTNAVIGSLLNPITSPNLGKATEIVVTAAPIYNIFNTREPEGGYMVGVGARFSKGSSITANYMQVQTTGYVSLQMTLPLFRIKH